MAAEEINSILPGLTSNLLHTTDLRSFGWTATLSPQGVIHDKAPKRQRRFQVVFYPVQIDDKTLLLVHEIRSKARTIQLAGLHIVLGRLIEGKAADVLTWYIESLGVDERLIAIKQVTNWMRSLE